jgi:uncharacterized protein YjiS (DUF1127 family)
MRGIKLGANQWFVPAEGFAMRELARFQAEHTIPEQKSHWEPVSFIAHLAHNIHARHVAQEMAFLDDHLLKDMGITRREVERASHAPINVDALETLRDAKQRHAQEFDLEDQKASTITPIASGLYQPLRH